MNELLWLLVAGIVAGFGVSRILDAHRMMACTCDHRYSQPGALNALASAFALFMGVTGSGCVAFGLHVLYVLATGGAS